MHAVPIPISGVSASRTRYHGDDSSDIEGGLSSGRSSPSVLSSFGAPLTRTSTDSDASRSIYGISELLSLAPLGASQYQYTSRLRDAFPEIVCAPRHPDDLVDHLDHLTLHSHPRPRRSRKPRSQQQSNEGAQQNKRRSHKWKPHQAPNHPSSNPSSVEDTPGWTTVHFNHHGHGGHNSNFHPPTSSSPPANSKSKRSAHGFRPASAWMSQNSSRGSQIDAMASWR